MSDVLDRGRKIAEEIGLTCKHSTHGHVYYADDIHRLLGEGVAVFGRKVPVSGLHGFGEQPCVADDLRGLTIAIRPLLQESEERKLLREIIVAHNKECDGDSGNTCCTYIERAKALLAKEPK